LKDSGGRTWADAACTARHAAMASIQIFTFISLIMFRFIVFFF
jgi:hypothetical protein